MSGPILIARIVGTPFKLKDLRPENALMDLAGVFRSVGRSVLVADAGNFETFESLYPAEVQADTYEWALRQSNESFSSLFTDSNSEFALPSRLKKRQHLVYEKVGERLVSRTEPTAAFFQITAKKDLHPTLTAVGRIRAIRPRAKLFAFGPAFDDDHTLSRALRSFDAVLLGTHYGAEQLCDSADRRAWRAIPNLAYYDGSRLILTRRGPHDEISRPNLDTFLYTASAEYSKIRVFDVLAVRSGAGLGSMHTSDATDHSGTLKAIRSMVDAFGSYAMCVQGDNGLERALLSSELRIAYATSINPADTARTRLGLLSAGGCVAVDVPVFSGSQRLLDTHYKKGFTVTQVERLSRAARFSGLYTSMHFTFPCREDDYHTEDETLRLVRRANPNSTVISEPASDNTPGGPLAFEFAPLRRRARARTRKQCVELRRKIREINVSTGIDAATALVASLAGYRGRESSFVEVTGLQLLSGDTTSVAELIEQINDTARQPARAIAFKPLNLTQNAAAN